MYFVVGLPQNEKKLDVVWVIVDRNQVGSLHSSGDYLFFRAAGSGLYS